MENFISIPFKASSANGFRSYNGVAKFSDAGVVLEFESKILDLFPTGVRETRLPMAEILDVKFKKGFAGYGAKIEIRLKSLARLAELPNNDGKLVLKIVKADIERAKAAIAAFEAAHAETPSMITEPGSVVSRLFDNEGDDAETQKLVN
ncbi:MAG: hypothetical protein IPM50_08335 [Acidobacteriota bacterium]|nr:MAG: hypothetical protein IPM50_08335 [Acidobacteriota bacterium]